MLGYTLDLVTVLGIILLAVFIVINTGKAMKKLTAALDAIKDGTAARGEYETLRSSLPTPVAPSRSDWKMIYAQVAALNGDSLEMNLVRRTCGYIDGGLQSAGIPYEFSTCYTDANDAEGLLDEAGRLRLNKSRAHHPQPSSRIIYAVVFRFMVPAEVEPNAREVVDAAVRRSNDDMQRTRSAIMSANRTPVEARSVRDSHPQPAAGGIVRTA